MKLNKKRGWIALAVLSAAIPSTDCFAQRGRDDADSYPAESRGGNEPPRLMRGGIMQQLRSVTDSVIGPFEDKPAHAENRNSNVPKPPALGQVRKLAEPRQGSVSQPRNSQPDDGQATAPENGNGQGRDWAGQFLIPNYRLRDQIQNSTNNAKNAARSAIEARRNSREDVAEQDGSPERVARQTQVPTPPPLGKDSAAPRRVYPGQSTSVKARMSDPVDSQAPAAVVSKLSDKHQEPTEEPTAEAPSEVAVSQVPDVPYVPRKPLPKRDTSQLLEKSLSAGGLQSSLASPASKSASTTNDKTKSTQAPSVSSALDSSLPSSSLPSPSLPSSSLPSSSSSDAAGATGSSLTPLPSVPSVPSVPSLEISKNLPSPQLPSTQLPSPPLPLAPNSSSMASQTSLPTASLPTASLPSVSSDSVKARPVSSPTGTPLPSGSGTGSNAGSANKTSPVPPSLAGGSLTLPAPPPPPPTLVNSTTLPLPPAAQTPATPSLAKPSVPSGTSQTAPANNGLSSSAPATGTPATGGLAKPSSERLNMEIPHVAVKLLGPGDLNTNTPTSYELVVVNTDRIPLSGLILRMETPPGVEVAPVGNASASCETEKADDGATLLTWSVAKVAAGSNARLPLQLKAATARNFAVAIEWTVVPQAGIHEIEVKQAELQVALEGPVDVEKDVTSVYRLKVTNPGSAVARRVKVQVLAGTQPANQIDVGDLEPGQTELVEMDLTFEKAGRIQIAASGVAEGGLKRDTNIAVAVHQPQLEANLALPASVPHGTPMIATVQLKNSGDAAARKLQAGLMLPPGSEFAQLPSGMSREGNKLLWNIDSLPPGEVVTVPIEVTLPSPGDHELKFACVYGKNQIAGAAAVTNVEAFSDLKLVVNDPVSPAPVGSAVSYEIVVTNRGSREAHDVAIVAQFSDGIEPESASGLKHRVVPGQVLFDSIPRIAAGESIKLKVSARAAVAGLHRFRVEVRTDETDAKLVEEEATRFLDSTGRVASPPSNVINR